MGYNLQLFSYISHAPLSRRMKRANHLSTISGQSLEKYSYMQKNSVSLIKNKILTEMKNNTKLEFRGKHVEMHGRKAWNLKN